MGISLENQPKIFQAHQTFGQGQMNKYGNGLGLNLCKNLATMMGGNMGFESTPYVSTEFWFTVKADIAKEEVKEMGIRRKSVIILDDNPMNAGVLASYAKKANIAYKTFTESEALLKCMDELDNSSVCLIDLYMPRVDGFEVARRIREKYE